MKLLREIGCTNQILQLYIRNQNSILGSGLTGLSSSTAGLTCYYNRDIDGAPTNIPLRAMTAGVFQASGIVEISATKMPGSYQFSAPNECFASGNSSHILFYGVENMEPLPIEVDLSINRIVENLYKLSCSGVAASVARNSLGAVVMAATNSVRGDNTIQLKNPWDNSIVHTLNLTTSGNALPITSVS